VEEDTLVEEEVQVALLTAQPTLSHPVSHTQCQWAQEGPV
jgi:hypothetical protein